ATEVAFGRDVRQLVVAREVAGVGRRVENAGRRGGQKLAYRLAFGSGARDLTAQVLDDRQNIAHVYDIRIAGAFAHHIDKRRSIRRRLELLRIGQIVERQARERQVVTDVVYHEQGIQDRH